jgi:nucleoid DNA-binding protein
MKTLSEIVDHIHKQNAGVTKEQIADIAAGVVNCIGQGLKENGTVRVHNLGTFSVNHREARMGRNPSTGEQITIAAKNNVKFKASKTLTDTVA